MSISTIENMVNWIEDNITDNPTLAGMSDYVGYSPFYCSAKFRENIGITFKKYLSKRRLTLAAAEVKNTHSRFLDIAVKYGFSSQEAFTRAFTDAYGCTPYQFRKQLIIVQLYMKPDVIPVPRAQV
ncbi:helix-turn-helix transcriptional regulator [Clostridium aminobutyricum]|uniref:Helix-turn-helix transcriptional regulator n=1 Tax=Clostridium aminobutyricum TaxID=33953 RepID=A0A939D8W8_CLOAM|nr:AraC family transcriptional regulator [Clostridium aminobutyricum]MBN7773619.1 helix-turn-helix transcriptional regulator [Clostridium aminobutyricum]